MRRSILAFTALAVLSVPALAGPGDQIGYRGWGPRIGFSSSPDQVHLGAHMDFGYFAEHFRLQPNMEIGFGSGRVLTAFNMETAYRFPTMWGDWAPYAGGGIGVDRISMEDHPEGSHSDLGVNALGGIEKELAGGDRFFLETKLGLTQAPDVKITAGWTFY
jgi:hypothetical protein